MKLERAIAVLKDAREQAERMAKMYEDNVIPQAVAALDSAKAQLHEQRSRIMEIDDLLATLNV